MLNTHERMKRFKQVIYACMYLPIKNEEGLFRHLQQGLGRRLNLINRNYEFISELITYNEEKPLSGNINSDLQIHLNSFYIHLKGSLDNLAWAFLYVINSSVSETEPATRKKADIFCKKFLIELQPKSQATFDLLLSHKKWISDLKEYRDPIAHRIPIYSPPQAFTPEEEKKFNDAQQEIMLFMKGETQVPPEKALHDIKTLGRYIPIISHHDGSSSKGKFLIQQMGEDVDIFLSIVESFIPILTKSKYIVK